MSPKHWIKHAIPKLNERRKLDILPHIAEGKTISKIIHQTFPSRQLPAELAENVRQIRALNPHWEYRFYENQDIDAFIRNNYNEKILSYYNRVDAAYGAARADLFRYLLIYKCGGVYLDMKSSLTRPLDSVLEENDCFILSQWCNKNNEEFEGYGLHWDLAVPGGEFQQWHVIAAPGHPFLRAVIETILMNIDLYLPGLHGVGQYGVVRVTGPVTYTRTIATMMPAHRYRLVDATRDLGLRYSIYPQFSHMKIYKANHYTVLKNSIVRLGLGKQILTKFISQSHYLIDAIRGRKPALHKDR